MTAKVTIPNTFATATTAIPLSQLDANFSNVSSTINNALTYSNYAADTGTANNYAITITGQTTTYAAGLAFQFKAANTNTGASTLNVNAQGTQSIVRTDGTALAAGDIIANGIVSVMYDGTNFQLMNDAGGKSESFTNITVTGNANASNVYVSSLTSGRVVYAGTNGQLVDSANLTFNGTTLTANTVVSTEQATIDGMAIGQGAGSVATNTAVGVSALAANTTGGSNIAFGYQALLVNTTGARNTAVGRDSLAANTTGVDNTAIGSAALEANTTASYNTAIGRLALNANTTGADNTAVGYGALDANTIGTQNTAVGRDALGANTTGVRNTAVGRSSLSLSTTATDNTAVGDSALSVNTTGSYNDAFGRTSLLANTTGQYNAGFGYQSLYSNTTGSYNTALGNSALYANTTASNNTAVGYQAMYSYQTGGDNVAVGTQAGYSINGNGNATFLGRSAGYSTTGGNNTFVGYQSGYYVSTGTKNTIVGLYNGNQGGLDIRTSSNYIVLSDGDGNPRQIISSNGSVGLNGRIPNTGGLNISGVGAEFNNGDNVVFFGRSAGSVLFINRTTSDGDLVSFYKDGSQKGTISVSGETISYNAFAGSHWSQLSDGSKPEIFRGTVLDSINELVVWPDESNERLCRVKISDTVGSKKVYGVFMDWDNDWKATNDMLVTSVGAFICRINGSVTVQEGDLLESNGDGTARVQADDVIRSSTIGKVTCTTKTHQYTDGSYCVPTVLYCG